jgi:hypothetical protein
MAIVGLGMALFDLAGDLLGHWLDGDTRESLVLVPVWVICGIVGGTLYSAFLPDRVRGQPGFFTRVRTAAGAAAGVVTLVLFAIVGLSFLSRGFFVPPLAWLNAIMFGAGMGGGAGWVASLIAGYSTRRPGSGTAASPTPSGQQP